MLFIEWYSPVGNVLDIVVVVGEGVGGARFGLGRALHVRATLPQAPHQHATPKEEGYEC